MYQPDKATSGLEIKEASKGKKEVILPRLPDGELAAIVKEGGDLNCKAATLIKEDNEKGGKAVSIKIIDENKTPIDISSDRLRQDAERYNFVGFVGSSVDQKIKFCATELGDALADRADLMKEREGKGKQRK